MNRRILFILLAVFAVLVIIAVIQAQPRPIAIQSPNSTGTPGASFLGRDLNLTVLDIQAIRLRDPEGDKNFLISRGSDGNWTAPGSEGRLDIDAASSIAKTVVLMGYQQTIPVTDSTDLSEYGFHPNGILSVEILRTNNEGHVIAVGGLAPSGLAYYTLVDELPQMYLIERGAVDYLKAYLTQPPLT